MTVLLLCCCLAGLIVTLAGCASLQNAAPDSVSLVFEHTSHITQHAPLCTALGQQCSNYGYDDIGISARWQSGPLWLQLSDAYTLMSGWQTLPGPREVFQASAGVVLWSRSN